MAQVAVLLLLVILILPSSTTANPVCKCKEQSQESSSKKVVDFNVHISESGEKYTEKIEVDPDKQTELFQVPAHPGINRSDVLHDFKKNLTMIRFPDSKSCYLFPLANEQLIQDLEKASEMVITESRRTDTTWIIDGEVSDRSVLSDELAQFCAKYSIYHVKKALDSLTATRIEREERANRKRRQSGMSNVCPGGMDRYTAYTSCYKYKKTCRVISTNCYYYEKCKLNDPNDPPPQGKFTWFRIGGLLICWNEHFISRITCCEYICTSHNPYTGPEL